MKHAYLIMAHHEPEVLQLLLEALDDKRNDVFIHFDRKCEAVPAIRMKKARAFILGERIDVRWGHRSQIDVELLLFERAYKKQEYRYYHLLSGVDMPIKSQDYIHCFFEEHSGKEFIGFTQGDTEVEITRKVRRYHLFSTEFRLPKGLRAFFVKGVRKAFLELQTCFGIKRYADIEFKKGTNWVSVSSEFVALVLSQKEKIQKMYVRSFCADEIFIQTICWNSCFRECVYDLLDSRNSSKRMIQWVNNEIVDWKMDDVRFLLDSPGLFARKFSKNNIDVAKAILQGIQVKEESYDG
ncbi:beta-1,6-N-acetylglucosaminyltransferase [Sphingobacterium yanglingense]|uniref:Peptide O-xylosyltransferase n=1 Tax=Sphingobacterium yanglingense TaxID=1437280 RepID=A0A4R6WI26_9SPHI|nr:beta-1,6-N-acetylglucosaminyltransferase [Sphingobacterium yanglingense]TDQ77991.1 core-2/I-Branching enzyme [Sphingobacterium yanglingense]